MSARPRVFWWRRTEREAPAPIERVEKRYNLGLPSFHDGAVGIQATRWCSRPDAETGLPA